MTITCDTELSEILDNNTICDPIIQFNNSAQHILELRTGVLNNALQSGGGCGPEQIVDDAPVFFNSGKELYDKYGTISESISTFATSVCQLAVTKELDELGELSDAIVKKINQLDEDIRIAKKEYEEFLEESDVDAATGEPPFMTLVRQRNRYEQKLEQVGARIKTINPEAEIAVAPSLAELDGAGAGDASEETVEPSEMDEEETPPRQSYTIDTEGATEAELYQNGKLLTSALDSEQAYLSSALAGVEYSIQVLESQHDAGNISDEVYEASLAEYQRKVRILEDAIMERGDALSVLRPAIEDKFGTDDGWLKDASETPGYGGTLGQEGNQEKTAAQVESEINSLTGKITPLEQVMEEAGINGTSPYYSDNVKNNPYGQALYNSQYAYTSYEGISPATQAAAYDYASNTGTATEIAPGVYCYSTQLYLNSDPYLSPPNMTTYSGNEWSTMDQGSYAYASPDGSGDTVYDSNTGKYCSWQVWNAYQNGELDSY